MFIVQIISSTNNSVAYVTNVGSNSDIKKAYKYKTYEDAVNEAERTKHKSYLSNIIILRNRCVEEVQF